MRICHAACLALCFVVGGSARLRAADPHGAKPAGAEGDSAHPAPANPLEPALDLAIWTWVVFLILVVVLYLFAWKPILEGLQKREANIQGEIDTAKRDRVEAARLREQFQKELNEASQTVRTMLDEARRDAQHTKDEMVAAARAEVQSEKERGRREIALARDQALQDIWNKTIELASSLSSTTIRRRLSPDDHRGLVDEALAGLGDAAADWRQRGGSQSA